MGLVVTVLSGFALAILTPLCVRVARGYVGWLLALLPAGLFVYLLGLVGPGTANASPISFEWVPSLGLSLGFRADGLALLFSLLITGVGALVFIYTGGYFAGRPQPTRLYVSLLIFMGSMLGLVLADNIIALFVFWELTSLSSYLLIGFNDEREKARSAALQALLVTAAGGLALLAGALLLGQLGRDLGLDARSSLELSSLLKLDPAAVHSHGLYLPIMVLLLLGAFTKSAQFPFHFWLPGAMEAPTSVSAYLHSATMVKAGVYLLARVHPIMGGSEVWLWTVSLFGGVTMLVGAVHAILETDLKRILAYSTVSALGVLVMLLGLGTTEAAIAAMTFLLAHALYKGALFLVAGAIDHQTGTRDATQLGGLGRSMPITAMAGFLAALSMAGLLPLFGFIAKELFYEATLASPMNQVVTGGGVLASMIFVAIAYICGIRPFIGSPTNTPKRVSGAPLGLWIGPTVLAVSGLGIGLFPLYSDQNILAPSVAALAMSGERLPGMPSPLNLVLWHGWTTALALSGITLLGGVGILALRGRFANQVKFSVPDLGPTTWYNWALVGLNTLARVQTRILQAGYLRYYLLTVFLATLGLVGYTLIGRRGFVIRTDWSDLHVYEAGLGGLVIPAVLAVVWARSRLTAIAALGVVGYSMALIFVLFGAPDLAMTQFLVETMTVIMFVLVFYHLPPPIESIRPFGRLRDAAIAIGVGALMTVLVLIAVRSRPDETVSAYFAEKSVPEAHGRNIVNVILVDFRAMDTLGEIVVLAAAGLGVYALLKLRSGPKEGT